MFNQITKQEDPTMLLRGRQVSISDSETSKMDVGEDGEILIQEYEVASPSSNNGGDEWKSCSFVETSMSLV
eukprot:scaffold66313_cov50-Attheya_sp.AAC.1